jgi:hypothetical protein
MMLTPSFLYPLLEQLYRSNRVSVWEQHWYPSIYDPEILWQQNLEIYQTFNGSIWGVKSPIVIYSVFLSSAQIVSGEGIYF